MTALNQTLEPIQDAAGQALAGSPCSLSSLLDSVICGDNVQILSGLPSDSVDLVVTSPPYDDLRTYGGHSWDFERLASELTRVLKPGGVIVWVVSDGTKDGSESLTSFKQAIHFKDVCGLSVYDTMIWKKPSPQAPTEGRYYDVFEYMFVLSKGKPKALNLLADRVNMTAGAKGQKESRSNREDRKYTGKSRVTKEMSRRFNVWEISRGESHTSHPAVFPESLAMAHVASWSNPCDVVLDPFAGSGTTLKAAKELGRRFVGIEINAEYVEICQRRIDQEVLNLFPDNVK
jgi:site-specific DNA-methyltransferase (adenine-specific)